MSSLVFLMMHLKPWQLDGSVSLNFKAFDTASYRNVSHRSPRVATPIAAQFVGQIHSFGVKSRGVFINMLIRQAACPRRPARMPSRSPHASRRGENLMEQERAPHPVRGAAITMVTYLHLITLPQTVPWQSGPGLGLPTKRTGSAVTRWWHLFRLITLDQGACCCDNTWLDY